MVDLAFMKMNKNGKRMMIKMMWKWSNTVRELVT